MYKEKIYNKVPILIPSKDKKYLVIGDDLDSYLSASLFIKHNPNTKIIGFYEEYNKLYLHKNFNGVLDKTLWIDLDIYNSNCISLGHHILRHSKNDTLHGLDNSFNLNEDRGVFFESFNRKCPISTIQFLFDLYEESYKYHSIKEHLIWLADSVYINAQKYRDNVQEWMLNYFNNPYLLHTFNETNTIEFEIRMANLFKRFENIGISCENYKYETSHLKLGGYQFRYKFNSDRNKIKRIASIIKKYTGYPNFYNCIINGGNDFWLLQGVRNSKSLNIYPPLNLIPFLDSNKVFSYVFPNKNSINYTSIIDFNKNIP